MKLLLVGMDELDRSGLFANNRDSKARARLPRPTKARQLFFYAKYVNE
jgi:hypothetical protein